MKALKLTNPKEIRADQIVDNDALILKLTTADFTSQLPNPVKKVDVNRIFLINDPTSTKVAHINNVLIRPGFGIEFIWANRWLNTGLEIYDTYLAIFDPAADAISGADHTTVGFHIENISGGHIAEEMILELAVFDDDGLAGPAATATFAIATKGTILYGENTAALKVKTNASGEFECTLTNPADGTVWVATSPTFGAQALDCEHKDEIVFSA